MNDFLYLEIIGQGGNGRVVKVKLRNNPGMVMAMKQLDKQKLGTEPGAKEQLINEVQIMESLNHPNILEFYGYFEDSRNVNLLTEYSEEGCLFNSKQTSRYELFSVLLYMADLFKATDYLHKRKPVIVHRDIKPENVLVFPQGVKLADFGTANYVDRIIKDTVCGTPEYLSPEMITKQGHNQQVDVWCLGILMYEMLSGKTSHQPKS